MLPRGLFIEAPPYLKLMATGLSTNEVVENELKEIQTDSKLSSVEFIACHKSLVQARIKSVTIN